MIRLVGIPLLLICNISSAEVLSSNASYIWSQYFASRSSLRINSYEDIIGLVNPVVCADSAQEMVSQLKAYSYASLFSLNRDANKLAEALNGTIQKATKNGTACLNELSAIYLFGSIYAARNWPTTAPQASWAAEDKVLLIGIFLYKRGLINFLTPESKEKLFDRKLQNKILGAYDCSSTTIYINPLLRPYDLVATFLHELSHLFRDKFYFSKEENKVKPNTNDHYLQSHNLSVRDFVLMDELLSMIYGGVYLRHARAPSEPLRSDIYNLKRDYTLYRRNGPFEKLWSETMVGQYETNWAYDIGLEAFLKRTFFLTSGASVGEVGRIEKFTSKIYQSLAKNYFGINSWQQRFLSEEFKSKAIELEPLAQWIGSPSSKPKVSEFLEQLYYIEQNESNESPTCRQFNDASISGELDSYVGTRKNKKPIKPGNEGVRPALRPCLNLGSEL